jgi:hypothetical protein
LSVFCPCSVVQVFGGVAPHDCEVMQNRAILDIDDTREVASRVHHLRNHDRVLVT